MKKFLVSIIISGILIGVGSAITAIEFMDWRYATISEIPELSKTKTETEVITLSNDKIYIYGNVDVRSIELILTEENSDEIKMEITSHVYETVYLESYISDNKHMLFIGYSYQINGREFYKLIEYAFKHHVVIQGTDRDLISIKIYGNQETLNKIVLDDGY